MRSRRPAVEDRPPEELFRSRLENQIDKLETLEGIAQHQMRVCLERAERIWRQRPKDKHKLYALHAPEVECIGKGKARKPYEFGVKVGIAVTGTKGLIVGARSFPGQSLRR